MRLLGLSSVLLAASFSLPFVLAAPQANDHAVSVSRSNETGLGFSHADNDEYTATIYVNGVPYQVILDTGSADTWIDPLSQGVTEPPNLFHVGINSSTTYVDGSTSTGPIVLADVTFGGYTVKNQAISIAYNGSTNPQRYNGLIGLGGAASSAIFGLLQNTTWAENGNTILYNLFDHEPDLPNYTTFLMSRSAVGVTDGGVLTVSEVLANMTEVLTAPEFVSPLPGQWTTVLDGVYVNGKFVTAPSGLAETFESKLNVSVPKGAVIATFDTGASLILGPREYADAIYGNIPGAKVLPPGNGIVSDNQTLYSLPCNAKVNVTWSIGGNLYPMHPADTIDVLQFDNGTFTCVGRIAGGAASPTEDILLGSPFLRNTYQLYDYGALNDLMTKPSIRLLSITDPDKAWAEADSVNLARVIAYQDAYQSTAALPESATPTDALSFTGYAPKPSLTSTDVASTPTGSSAPSASATATGQVGAADKEADVRLSGAVADSDSDPTSPVDLSTLTRNSYVILGLLAAVLLMLVVVAALVVKAGRANKGYRAVPQGTLRGSKPFEADSEPYYSTPYDDGRA